MIGIYKITNKINNKIYIGKSINIKERWSEHIRESLLSEEKWNLNKRGEQTPIHKAIRKYGKDNFIFEVIEECTKEELNNKEIKWISYFNSTSSDIGYNLTLGGDGYNCGKGENAPGNKITQEECNIIKQKLKERWTVKQIQTLVPLATPSMVSNINYGISWFDENETYPISIDNGHRIWSDEEAMLIKQKYANGINITDLAKEYQVHISTIKNLVSGISYSNLPMIERKVDWKRTNKKVRLFTNEDVIKYRKEFYENKKSIKSLHESCPISCNYAAFYNMIKGITYKEIGGLPNNV